MGWNAMTFDGRDTILRVLGREAEGFFALAERPAAWEAPTACTGWQVRDVVGHLVDTTESYFEAFDAARDDSATDPAFGVLGMAARADERARSLRDVPQGVLMERARADFAKMAEIFDAIGPDDWCSLQVAHFYLGPLPAFFYPAFQLMDYGVHSWDIRQGTGRPHGLAGDVADLLVPFMFVLWQSTVRAATDRGTYDIGIRVTSGPNAGDTVMHVTADGMTYEPGDVSAVPAVIEFDPASFVLTTFGRSNAGTVRGDTAIAERFLGLFFRI